MTTTPEAGSRRRYDSELRRQQAAQTRERIVEAGAELLRGSSIRDWNALTIRGVAERAGVNVRTVYRYFANERALRDAVMHRLEADAGIDLDSLRLEDLPKATAAIFRHVSSYPMDRRLPLDPTLAEAHKRQHDALLGAVAARASQWPDGDQTLAAAMLDVLWGVASYERLVVDWSLDRDEAIRGITWVIGLIEIAIGNERRLS